MPNVSSKIGSSMLWRFCERISSQTVSFLVSMVLARLLLPDDYGIVAIIYIFYSILDVFVSNGFSAALIQKKEVSRLEFSSMFWCSLVLAILLYVFIYVFAPYIADFYEMPLLTELIRVFALRLPLSSFSAMQLAYVSREMDFRKFFYSTFIATVISAIVGVGMAYNDYGAWALIGQVMTSTLVSTIVLLYTVRWRPTFEFSLDVVKPLISYGWKILATDLIGITFNNVNAFIIGKFYTASDLAYYNQGKKIPDLLNSNISNTLVGVLFPAMSLSSGIEDIKNIRRKCLAVLGYLVLPMMLGMYIMADKVIILVFSDKWAEAIIFFKIACIDAIVGILGTTFVQEIKAIGRSDITFKMELIKKPIFLIVVLLCIPFGVEAIAWSLVINGILAFFFNLYPVQKYIGFDYIDHLRDLFPAVWMSIVMAMIAYITGYFINDMLICLIVQMSICIITYMILSILTENKVYIFLKEKIKK